MSAKITTKLLGKKNYYEIKKLSINVLSYKVNTYHMFLFFMTKKVVWYLFFIKIVSVNI